MSTLTNWLTKHESILISIIRNSDLSDRYYPPLADYELLALVHQMGGPVHDVSVRVRYALYCEKDRSRAIKSVRDLFFMLRRLQAKGSIPERANIR